MAWRNRFRIGKFGNCFLFVFAQLLPGRFRRALMSQDAFQRSEAESVISDRAVHGRQDITLGIDVQQAQDLLGLVFRRSVFGN